MSDFIAADCLIKDIDAGPNYNSRRVDVYFWH